MYVKSTRVRSGKKIYEYLSLVEGYRDETGKVRQRTLFRSVRPAGCERPASWTASSKR